VARREGQPDPRRKRGGEEVRVHPLPHGGGAVQAKGSQTLHCPAGFARVRRAPCRPENPPSRANAAHGRVVLPACGRSCCLVSCSCSVATASRRPAGGPCRR
jgi:hypothetical protein